MEELVENMILVLNIEEHPGRIQNFLEQLFLAFFGSDDIESLEKSDRESYAFFYITLKEFFDQTDSKLEEKQKLKPGA